MLFYETAMCHMVAVLDRVFCSTQVLRICAFSIVIITFSPNFSFTQTVGPNRQTQMKTHINVASVQLCYFQILQTISTHIVILSRLVTIMSWPFSVYDTSCLIVNVLWQIISFWKISRTNNNREHVVEWWILCNGIYVGIVQLRLRHVLVKNCFMFIYLLSRMFV